MIQQKYVIGNLNFMRPCLSNYQRYTSVIHQEKIDIMIQQKYTIRNLNVMR